MEPRFIIFMILFFVLSFIIIVTHFQLYKMVKKNFMSSSKPVEKNELATLKEEVENLKIRVEALEKKS